jgi:hypothetical protein
VEPSHSVKRLVRHLHVIRRWSGYAESAVPPGNEAVRNVRCHDVALKGWDLFVGRAVVSEAGRDVTLPAQAW